ncbi:MAG TPA: thioredoxin domain-containing protein [Gaiellaceae bacterium]|nr:thioredoxin domain-containing protein [Gaiellaceae bacterium]
MSRRTIVLVSLGVAVAAAAVVAALALGSGGSKQSTTLAGVASTASMLRGIPQQGEALGSPAAPVTLVEFADPQCPYCGMWARDALPTIVDLYVRTGKVRIVFVGMAFVGADSATALRTALAAGEDNHFWNVIELLYENQGTENTGWVTDSLLHSIGAAVPGLDTSRMLASRNSPPVDRAVARAAAMARSAGVNSTPSFEVGRTGRSMHLVQLTSLDAAALAPALDVALAG